MAMLACEQALEVRGLFVLFFFGGGGGEGEGGGDGQRMKACSDVSEV